MKTVSVINQKGGVGKSTTAEMLVSALSMKGFKVLAVDLDAQGNLSYSLAADLNSPTVLEVLTEEISAKDAIKKARGDIISSNKALAGADAFIADTGKEYRLKEALEKIAQNYDFCIIDTPPALGILTINALTASNSVIIPAQADIYSLQGIENLEETIKAVKKYCNPALEIEGILLTRYNPRTILSREVSEMAEKLAKKLETKLFKSKIRDAVAVKEAQISQESLFKYAPKSNVTKDYENFINEFLGKERKKKNG